MQDWLQSEWQRESPAQLLLRPLSWAFALLVALRRWAYHVGLIRAVVLPVPVIVVGNISVGGTGKTPLTIALAEHLQQRGWRPGIVSRGYGAIADDQGRHAHVEIRQGGHAPDWFGDEPLIMAARLTAPVYVGAERAEAAAALLRDHPQVNVILSDDGLQHYAMARDVEIAVVDGERGFGNGHLMPAGPLRESPQRLRSVQAVVVNGESSLPGEFAQGAPTFGMHLGNERFVSLLGGEEYSPEDFLLRAKGQRVIALAGIGNPGRFFSHLRRLGVTGVGRAFPDHHRYVPSELRFPEAELLLMTEKDAVKCRAFADQRMWFMRVDAQVPAAFFETIESRLRPN